MKKFGVPVAFRTKAPEGPGADLARYVDLQRMAFGRGSDRIFVVDAETGRKAENKVKRYCETKGLEVLDIRAAKEAEVLDL
jgi:hypothetical protein